MSKIQRKWIGNFNLQDLDNVNIPDPNNIPDGYVLAYNLSNDRFELIPNNGNGNANANIDGGFANSVYTPEQCFDGGNANG